MVSRIVISTVDRFHENAVRRAFGSFVQEIDRRCHIRVQGSRHRGHILKDTVRLHLKDACRVDRIIVICRADKLRGHKVVLQDLQRLRLLFFGLYILKGLRIAQ